MEGTDADALRWESWINRGIRGNEAQQMAVVISAILAKRLPLAREVGTL